MDDITKECLCCTELALFLQGTCQSEFSLLVRIVQFCVELIMTTSIYVLSCCSELIILKMISFTRIRSPIMKVFLFLGLGRGSLRTCYL